MEQKNKTLDLQGLFDFIENGERFRVFDKEKDSFIIESFLYNTTWQIQYNVDDEIEHIISQTIEQLEDFDVDERFIELWNKDYSPSQFLRMLQEDEVNFRKLADKLRTIRQHY